MDQFNEHSDVPDPSGLALPGPMSAWISVGEASHLFSLAYMPRNNRTIRRYCERGDLECRKTENALHQPQYFIDPDSVETYIAQQKTMMSAAPGLPGSVRAVPDESRLDFASDGSGGQDDLAAIASGPARSQPGQSGQGRVSPRGDLVDQLQARLEDKDEEIAFLRGELLHRRTTDTALHDVIAAFRANAEAQRLAAAPSPEGQGTTHHQSPVQ